MRTDRRFQEPIYADYLEGEVYPLFQPSHTFTLQGPERASIGRLLSMLGVTRDFDEGELSTLANACGSNLALVAKLADHLKQNPAYRIGDGAAAESEIMREILEARLIQAKRSGKRIVDTLEYASILGSPFRYADLACVSGQDRSDVVDQLRQAADLEFVDLMDERAAFVHDAFIAHFRERLSDRRARSYKRLAECVDDPRWHDIAWGFRLPNVQYWRL